MSGTRSALLAAVAALLTPDGNGNILLGQSAPQFDNSLRLATMAAVQRALGNAQGVTPLPSASVLTAAAAGNIYRLTGSTAFSTTLPLANSVPAGTKIYFESISTVANTVVTQGSDKIYFGNTEYTSVNVYPFGDATLSTDGTVWKIEGESALGGSSLFATGSNSQGTYFKFPNGLIIQVGTINASGGWAWSFPITFPTNCLVCMATDVDTGASFASLYNWTASYTYGDRWNLSGGNPSGETAIVAFGH